MIPISEQTTTSQKNTENAMKVDKNTKITFKLIDKKIKYTISIADTEYTTDNTQIDKLQLIYENESESINIQVRSLTHGSNRIIITYTHNKQEITIIYVLENQPIILKLENLLNGNNINTNCMFSDDNIVNARDYNLFIQNYLNKEIFVYQNKLYIRDNENYTIYSINKATDLCRISINDKSYSYDENNKLVKDQNSNKSDESDYVIQLYPHFGFADTSKIKEPIEVNKDTKFKLKYIKERKMLSYNINDHQGEILEGKPLKLIYKHNGEKIGIEISFDSFLQFTNSNELFINIYYLLHMNISYYYRKQKINMMYTAKIRNPRIYINFSNLLNKDKDINTDCIFDSKKYKTKIQASSIQVYINDYIGKEISIGENKLHVSNQIYELPSIHIDIYIMNLFKYSNNPDLIFQSVNNQLSIKNNVNINSYDLQNTQLKIKETYDIKKKFDINHQTLQLYPDFGEIMNTSAIIDDNIDKQINPKIQIDNKNEQKIKQINQNTIIGFESTKNGILNYYITSIDEYSKTDKYSSYGFIEKDKKLKLFYTNNNEEINITISSDMTVTYEYRQQSIEIKYIPGDMALNCKHLLTAHKHININSMFLKNENADLFDIIMNIQSMRHLVNTSSNTNTNTNTLKSEEFAKKKNTDLSIDIEYMRNLFDTNVLKFEDKYSEMRNNSINYIRVNVNSNFDNQVLVNNKTMYINHGFNKGKDCVIEGFITDLKIFNQEFNKKAHNAQHYLYYDMGKVSVYISKNLLDLEVNSKAENNLSNNKPDENLTNTSENFVQLYPNWCTINGELIDEIKNRSIKADTEKIEMASQISITRDAQILFIPTFDTTSKEIKYIEFYIAVDKFSKYSYVKLCPEYNLQLEYKPSIRYKGKDIDVNKNLDITINLSEEKLIINYEYNGHIINSQYILSNNQSMFKFIVSELLYPVFQYGIIRNTDTNKMETLNKSIITIKKENTEFIDLQKEYLLIDKYLKIHIDKNSEIHIGNNIYTITHFEKLLSMYYESVCLYKNGMLLEPNSTEKEIIKFNRSAATTVIEKKVIKKNNNLKDLANKIQNSIKHLVDTIVKYWFVILLITIYISTLIYLIYDFVKSVFY